MVTVVYMRGGRKCSALTGKILVFWIGGRFNREIKGAFHSTKIPVRNFGNFACSMERCIPVAQTRPKPPRVLLHVLWLRSTLAITL